MIRRENLSSSFVHHQKRELVFILCSSSEERTCVHLSFIIRRENLCSSCVHHQKRELVFIFCSSSEERTCLHLLFIIRRENLSSSSVHHQKRELVFILCSSLEESTCLHHWRCSSSNEQHVCITVCILCMSVSLCVSDVCLHHCVS